ncbi:MAG: hypothetical protein R3F30_04140 [Planctomycetota bacterium]
MWLRLAEEEIPPILARMRADGPVFLTDKARAYLADNPDLAPVLASIERRYVLRPAGAGHGRGAFLEPR